MTTKKSCTIKILDKSYEVKCPDNEKENLLLAVAKLNEKMASNKNKFKRLDDFQILLLAALDIGHELVICQKEQEQQRHQVNQFISSLESRINKTVGGDYYTIQATD